MSNLVYHAERELDLIGMTEDSDGMNSSMRNHILHMIEQFAKEGHSGFSAFWTISCLEKLMRFEPISPLTGEDWEWSEVSDGLYQNNRCSSVFKDANRFDGQPYDINGKIFVEHYYNKDGEERTSSYANGDSHVVISFPYTPETEYVDVGFRNETI